MCAVCLFSPKESSNKMPIMEVIDEQAGLVRHYTNLGISQNALLYL